jgi:hypothetical protein
MKIPSLFLLLPLTVLTGCATGYQGSGFTGGHFQSPGPGQMEKVSFSGNGYIDSHTVQQYALYRCAEVAKEKNSPYFVIYDSLSAAAADKPSEQPSVGTIGNKPIAYAYLLPLKATRGGAKETDKVLKDLEPIIKKDQADGNNNNTSGK